MILILGIYNAFTFQVSAEDKGTGNKEKIVITNDQNRLTPDDIDRMIRDAEKFADDDKKLKERVESRNELESYAYSLKTQLADKDKLGAKVIVLSYISGPKDQSIRGICRKNLSFISGPKDQSIRKICPKY